MNDDLKSYITDHRDDFDHLEPSPTVFTNIHQALKTHRKEKKGILQLVKRYKWAVAASFSVLFMGTYLLVNRNESVEGNKNQQSALSTKKIPFQQTEKIPIAPKSRVEKRVVQHPVLRMHSPAHKAEFMIDLPTLYANLTDSSSASTRLAAILELKESTAINNDMIDRLANTLNNDPNSNVRLAVLDLMGNYVQYGYVTKVFIQSLGQQSDPAVQLELIQLLAQTNDAKLDEKLYALANDPATYLSVKDQAYLVLLNQNKL